MANHRNRPSRQTVTMMVLLVSIFSWSHAGAESSTEQSVRNTLDQGIAAFNKEDLETTLKALHPDSPNYQVTKERISRVFEGHDVKFELVDFDFVGETGPYAIVRAKEKSTKKTDSDFRDNVTESLYIFRKQGDDWKLWGEYTLGTVFSDK